MKVASFTLFVLLVHFNWAQDAGDWKSLPPNFVLPAKQQLVCPKYQHVFHWDGTCGPAPCDSNSCYAVCTPPPPDTCVDDMHELTERDWQQLMERVRALELKLAKEKK